MAEVVDLDIPNLTETEKNIIRLLGDGTFHYQDEIVLECLKDGTQRGSLHVHVHNLRKKLNPKGFEIVCMFQNRRTGYRLVRPIGPA